MTKISFILFSCIIATGLLSCGGGNTQTDMSAAQDIVIVGGDTLGRDWDDKPTQEEADQAAALGLTPEQYKKMKDEVQQKELQERMAEQNMIEEQSWSELSQQAGALDDFEPTNFSDKMHKEQTQTIITPDGREVVVGTSTQY